MFRIRRIHDNAVAGNRAAIAAVQQILRDQFPMVDDEDIEELPAQLVDPMTFRLRTVLLVAEGDRSGVKGFALMRYAPDIDLCLLDYLSAESHGTGAGVGGALYQVVRQEAAALDCFGVFLECVPDDPAQSADPAIQRQNKARLRFYESFGAYPIIGTQCETLKRPGVAEPYFLVYDDLGSGRPLSRRLGRRVVRAVLERSYLGVCPPDYIDQIVQSFVDDPVRLRAPRYGPPRQPAPVTPVILADRKIVLIVNDQHDIHHVRERGYVESPVRIPSVLKAIEPTGLFRQVPPRRYGERHIRGVHASSYVDYFKRVCADMPAGKAIYPEVFPIRNHARPPLDLAARAGYYCIDNFTPLSSNAFLAARRAVDCALTGADHLIKGYRLAYALVRPPGHHAERRSFGGFCYFNNTAIAAQRLSQHGLVAILDVDYHAGNGQQEIFWRRNDVLTLSIHGGPRFAYPYFSGFDDERGEGPGKGFHRNYALPEEVDGPTYARTLERALRRIRTFAPDFLVVALGFDTAKDDPAGTWSLRARDFAANGRAIGALRLPTLAVQEGGYRTRTLGINARHFFTGLWEASIGEGAGGGLKKPGRRPSRGESRQ